jgi:hypothetical protein
LDFYLLGILPVELSLSSPGALFTIDNGAEFTLEKNIILNGLKPMANDAPLVIVENASTFNMNGGAIIDNESHAQHDFDFSKIGGGVFVTKGSTFNMSGGKISGNDAYDHLTGFGGGVSVHFGSTFTMTDGEISGNIARDGAGGGGGVYIDAFSSFNLHGGKISGNITGSHPGTANGLGNGLGGGITIRGSLIMTGGEISGNEARNGGGLYIYGGSPGPIIISGGIISGNFANDNGGGIFVEQILNMTGGTITGNTARKCGGGVYFVRGYNVLNGLYTHFIKTGGDISGNVVLSAANSYGHQVYVDNSYAPSITDNLYRDTDAGWGVNLDSANIANTGGEWNK